MRAKRIVTDKNIHKGELEGIRKVLRSNNYPSRMLDKIAKLDTQNVQHQPREWQSTVTIPYREGISEDIRRVLNANNIRVFFKTNGSLRKLLVHMKDPIPQEEVGNCVYKISCAECEANYIGQTSRQLKIRMNEHLRACKRIPKNSIELMRMEKSSAIALHALTNNHKFSKENVTILQKGFHTHQERCVAESLHILSSENVLNRQDGLTLCSVWFDLLDK